MIEENEVEKKEISCPKVIKKKVTSRDYEKLEVARLSCYIEPRSKPSDVFEKLQEKRRIRHEKVIRQLAVSLHDVNMRIEKSIRISSMELKAHVKEYDSKLELMLQGIDKLEIAMCCSTFFIELQHKVSEYKHQQQKLVNEFYEDLITFENSRAKENASLLHLATQEISKIGYFLPYDVQTFVEHETLKMNQLSLNNRRCYEDLKLTLTLVTEQTFKSFMDRVFCIRENWVQRKMHETLYNAIIETEEQPLMPVQKYLTRLDLEGEELEIHDDPSLPYSTCRADDWVLNVEKVISIIDSLRKSLIEVFKKTIKAIYNGFGPEVEEIKVGMSLIEDLVIQERSIKPLIIDVHNSPIKDTEEMETHWQSTLEDIRNQLKHMTDFIREIGRLWDGHVERVCESKKLVLRALEKSEQKSRAVQQDLEVKINLGLDVLRQEHVHNKLEKLYENVLSTLKELKTNYETEYLKEVSIIEDFYKMIHLEADVLTADIKEFIVETSGMKFIHGFSGQFRYLRDVDFGGDQIFKEMKLCSQQIQNMKFWKQGIWVALETISGRTRESLRPRAEKWIKNKVESLAEKRTVQLELLDKRIQRTETEVYNKRMMEIKNHQNLFDKHKEKIWSSFQKSRDELENLVRSRLEKLRQTKNEIYEIENSLMEENLPGVIRGNQAMIERKKQDFETDLEMEFQRFRAHCERKLTDNQELNVNFMKSIKLFHEDGDYNAEEAKSLINLLEGIDKDISAEIKSIIKDSDREEDDLTKEVTEFFDQTIDILMDLYEETIFNQQINQRLQNFAAVVQEAAKILKLDFDTLNEHFGCTRKYAENPTSTLDMTEDRLWNFLLQLLYKNVSNLLYPVKLPEGLVQTGKEEKQESTEEGGSGSGSCCCAGKYPVNFSNSKLNLLRKLRISENFSCKEYGDKLFNCEIPLEDDGSFMSSMFNNISAEFTHIEKAACNFYKNVQARKVIRVDLIANNYENFIERILNKFSYYSNEIQKFWLKILTDFLPLLGDIKELCNALLLKKLNTYKESALTALKNFEDDFRECLQTQICENAKEFDELDKKLLPLHGYPHNVHLLNELEELVVAKTANQELKWEKTFRNFKGQVKCFRVQHIQDKFEINNIELLYMKLRDTLFIEDLGSKLMQEILNICNNGGFCIKKFSKNSFVFDKKHEEEGENSDEAIPEKQQLHINDKNLSTVQDYIQQLRQMIEKDRFSGVQGPKRPSTPGSYDNNPGESLILYHEKFNTFMDIVDFGEHAAGTLQIIDKCIRCLKAFAETEESFHEQELFKWLNKWKSNVKKIQKLYRTKCETNPSVSGVVRPENNKPNPEKTSASVTSPRLCPTSKLDIKDITCNIPILKIRCPRDRPISDEYKKRSDVLEHSKTNLQKSKLTESNNSGQVGFTNAALFLTSPRNYHGLIPVLHKRSLNLLRMSPPSTRSASPIKKLLPKEKSSSKVKTITLEPRKKKISDASRSPSPVKRAAINYKQSKSRTSTSPVHGFHKNSEKIKQQTNKQGSPRVNSPTKIKSKPTVLSSPKLECASKGKRKELPSNGHLNSVILKQTSQPSLCINEKIIQPQEKISLDHLKNEVYSGDHRRLSFEKVHLCIEKSVENLNMAERKRSYLVTYSSDDYKNQEEISLAFLQDLSSTSITTYSTDGDRKKGSEKMNDSKAAIRTLSGNELILTPSMKLDIEKGESDDIEISDLLHETGEGFEDSKVRIPQDDANEYDSEVSTDGELTERDLTVVSSKSKDMHSGNSLWKSQEADLLNDVDYRQSVYHPAVSRRQKSESMDNEFRPKSKSIEDNFSFTSKMTKRVTRSRSSTLKPKYPTQCFSRDKIEASNNDRSWSSNFDKADGKQIYNSVMQDVPFYGMKRSRTKKERISGALLHFTLKVIRLLAIFNLWPGDNCYMLTSQSLRSSFSSPCMVSEGKLKEDY